MSRILHIDESNANLLQRLLISQTKRSYGVLPGIMKVLMPNMRIGFIVGHLYSYLHLRKKSPMTRLQREMLATVVNGAIGGAP